MLVQLVNIYFVYSCSVAGYPMIWRENGRGGEGDQQHGVLVGTTGVYLTKRSLSLFSHRSLTGAKATG